jgi:hypothetical protein
MPAPYFRTAGLLMSWVLSKGKRADIPWGGGSFGWGTATISYALDAALNVKGGDALLNVRVTTSLYNFLIYAFTCTTVEGTAIRFHSR